MKHLLITNQTFIYRSN